MRPKLHLFAAGAALTAAFPVAAEPVSTELRISGIVPTICNVSFGTGMGRSTGSAIELGTMARFCNDSAGYRVVLETPRGLSNATFVYGAVRVPLSADGETVIIDSSQPELGAEPARIEIAGATALPEGFNLSVRAEPKGAIY